VAADDSITRFYANAIRIDKDVVMVFGRVWQLFGKSAENRIFGGPPHPVNSFTIFAIFAVAANALASNVDSQVLTIQQGNPFCQNVKVVIEVAGDLTFNAEEKKLKKLPITVEANLLYGEKFLPGTTDGPRSIRNYQDAQAKMQINGKDIPQVLRSDRRIVVMQPKGDETVLFSPLGPLTRDELELIDSPGRPAGIAGLLPAQPVRVTESWAVKDGPLAQLLCLDVITQQDVKANYSELKDGVALIRFEGKVNGAVTGIATEIELKGSLNIDVARRTATWLALMIKENRTVGQAQPGFETVTRVRMVMQPTANILELSDRALAGLTLEPKAANQLIELATEKGGFSCFHDRRWRSMVDRHDVAVLRLVERSELISQCNISSLPPLPAGEQLTLEGFQQDVRAALDKNFGQFVEAKQTLNENKIAVLRIVATGMVQEVPIEWIYYHLTDAAGNRASLVFTHTNKQVERIAGQDQAIVGSFRFKPVKTEVSQAKPVVSPTPATAPVPATSQKAPTYVPAAKPPAVQAKTFTPAVKTPVGTTR
jgi:hypothetical protein